MTSFLVRERKHQLFAIYTKWLCPWHACHDGLLCLGIKAEKFFFFSNLHGRNSRVQKNNYDFDKVRVVEIQEGSKY